MTAAREEVAAPHPGAQHEGRAGQSQLGSSSCLLKPGWAGKMAGWLDKQASKELGWLVSQAQSSDFLLDFLPLCVMKKC